MDPAFQAAVALVDAGRADDLRELLGADPELVRARGPQGEEFYEGYFAGATLLHHVAGNPLRGAPFPSTAPEVARVLLEAGAEVDAECGGGPSQPTSCGWTTLGFVASSAPAAEAGLAERLIDVLLEFGADVDHRGRSLETAIYHVVECRQQRGVAEVLLARGARVDLRSAAALGRVDLVDACFAADGTLLAGAFDGWRGGEEVERPGAEELLQEALVYAGMNGRNDTIDRLVVRGADLARPASVAQWSITALHGAGWAGWPETVRHLIAQGADPALREPTYNATPLGWAAHDGRTEAIEAFLEHPSRIDLLDLIELGRDDLVRDRLGGIHPDAALGADDPGVLLRNAAHHGRVMIVRELLDRGADPNLANREGHTALSIARAAGHDEAVELLQERGARDSLTRDS